MAKLDSSCIGFVINLFIIINLVLSSNAQRRPFNSNRHPSIMESYAPSGSFASSGHRYRHHHTSHVVQTEPPPPQLSSPKSTIQRGDQEPAGDDLTSVEEEQQSYSLESDGDESYLDSFQRPGMINNHINYNQYNTIFRRGGGPVEQRQQSAFVEDGVDLRLPVAGRSYSVYRHHPHG
ncbi:hypothetical protein pipiens_019692, partial [Culex pipiens pipiens]